ncbi:MAG: hypothetical protein DCC67_08420 [Planctomycetota bacterium]|nr:MAG: hypothetical protein DCC67_08420 [Planctomycetota bacterium]
MLHAAAAYLPWLWLTGAPLTLCLLAAGLIGAERLRRHGTLLASGPAFEACQRLAAACRLSRRVSLATCDSIAQPILIGIFRPLILLPASALSGWTPEELEMVLLHELAHVRRWDNLVNLVQRLVESLLFFHPAVWLVSRQVRRDREECCDAVVVRRTERPREYAKLLVSIASALPRGKVSRLAGTPLATGSTMASHPLTGRIRRILKLQEEPMGLTRRTLAAMVALPLVATAVTFYTANAQEEQTSPPSQGKARRGMNQPDETSSGVKGGIIAKFYPVADFVAMDWQQWTTLIRSDPRIDVRSAADRRRTPCGICATSASCASTSFPNSLTSYSMRMRTCVERPAASSPGSGRALSSTRMPKRPFTSACWRSSMILGQAAKHADAVRALNAMFKNKSNFSDQARAELYRQRRQLVADRLKAILTEGDASLVAPALAGVATLAKASPARVVKIDSFVSADTPDDRVGAIEAAVAQADVEIQQLTDPQFLEETYGFNLDADATPGGGFF